MKFEMTGLAGVVLIDLEPHHDARGFFARAWCDEEAEAAGILDRFVQMNLSYTRTRGTIRGLHYQRGADAEGKLVRCIRGAVFDVAADVAPDSATYGRWTGVELTAESRRAIYLPPGCAHGNQTLSDDAELLYSVTSPYAPDAEAGVRYDDPFFGIDWPLPVHGISDKDAGWPPFGGS